MKTYGLKESTKINQSSEIDVGGNIHELLVMRPSNAIRQVDIAGDEIAVQQYRTFFAARI
jgi:hypothetical protein